MGNTSAVLGNGSGALGSNNVWSMFDIFVAVGKERKSFFEGKTVLKLRRELKVGDFTATEERS